MHVLCVYVLRLLSGFYGTRSAFLVKTGRQPWFKVWTPRHIKCSLYNHHIHTFGFITVQKQQPRYSFMTTVATANRAKLYL